MIEESEVDEVVIEEGDLKITVRKSGVEPAARRSGRRGRRPLRPPRRGADEGTNGYHLVKSKWVATFYRSPSPQSPSFVEVGDEVEAGQTLCILEMMKMMNELTADVSGVVREILVENGETVQYGQPLFAIEPA